MRQKLGNDTTRCRERQKGFTPCSENNPVAARFSRQKIGVAESSRQISRLKNNGQKRRDSQFAPLFMDVHTHISPLHTTSTACSIALWIHTVLLPSHFGGVH